ncbi:hypothetical protein C8R45DRAFT_937993 [Mycena sanguinolenta]|nr:hypothetical protein C8R45DRAFT_937993 [Mycena sanguinolenta]
MRALAIHYDEKGVREDLGERENVTRYPEKRGDQEKNQSRKDVGEGMEKRTSCASMKREVPQEEIPSLQEIRESRAGCPRASGGISFPNMRDEIDIAVKAMRKALKSTAETGKSATLALFHALSTDEFVPEAVTTLSSRAKVERAVSATSAKEINTEEKTDQISGDKITGNRGALHACAEKHAGSGENKKEG